MNRLIHQRRVKPVTLAIIVIIAAVAGHALIIARFVPAQEAYDSLIAEIADTQLTLNRFKDIEELKAELRARESELESTRAIIPSKQSNTLAIDSLLRLAESTDLEVLDVTSQIGDNENAGESSYGSMTIRLQVAGSLGDLIAFLKEVENGAVKAARVDDLSIVEMSRSSEVLPQESSVYGQTRLIANMRISVFTRI